MSPTARSLRELCRLGYLPAVVEKFIPGARVRRDLYGIIDVLGVCNTPEGIACVHRADGRPGVLGVQACVTGDMAKRVDKVRAAPGARVWLANGLALEVWGWALRGPRGTPKRWTLAVTPITVDMLAPTRGAEEAEG